jgi:hypothetical protein
MVADGKDNASVEVNEPKEASTARTSLVLVGTENYTAKETQIGLALRMATSGVPSTLMIPNVLKVTKGGEGGEVFITKPMRLNGDNLQKFLINKGLLTKGEDDKVKEPVGKFLEIAEIALEAFYFNKTGPWLMQFSLNMDADGKGIVGALTDDDDLAELFTVLGASVRVFKCNDDEQYKALQQYVDILSAE